MGNLAIAYKYILSDYFRYKGKKDNIIKVICFIFSNHNYRYSFWYRLASRKNIFTPIARIIRALIASRYGILISRKTKIGYGLYIGHGFGVIVNSSATIGNNCNLSQFVTIGANDGKAATIGDNVYIGPSVCLIENVTIGNNVSIGAGAVVTKDIPDNATAAGVPAKVINYNNPARYINNKWTDFS